MATKEDFSLRITIASLAVLLLASCASHQHGVGHSVSRKSFEIVGGETVSLPFDDEGPVDAENSQFRVDIAGFKIGRSKSENSKNVLTWKLSFLNKAGLELESVTVEEVALSKQEMRLVVDSSPNSNDGVWRGSSQDVIVSPETTPWLYETGTSTFIYRFKIKPKGAPNVVLYQPALFPDQAKAMFRRFMK